MQPSPSSCCYRALLAWPAALLLLLLLAASSPSRAAQCPPLRLKTVDAACRWVLGKLVPCDSPAAPGTRASFTCKPLHRLPRTRSAESSLCQEDGTWAPLPFSCKPECGRLKGNGQTLIVDGKPVNSPNEYPWHVAVYDKQHKEGVKQVCGGTLITPKFFVSAAHCFVASSSPGAKNAVRLRPAGDYAAAVGKLIRDWDAAEPSAQSRDVLEVHINGYGGPRLNHVKDLALVEMVSPVDMTASTLPVCVDWGNEERSLRNGDVGTVVGWGNLRNAQPGEKLQSASLPFVPKDTCLQLVPSQLVQYILLSDDRFCAGLINGSTVAHGDSGGGLAFPNADRVWFLRGVVSVGMPEMRTLSAFTNVSSFVRWMADKIEDEEIRASAAEHYVPVEIPKEYTASDLEEEQRVAYFREDLGLSLHHMHFHYYYSYLGPKEFLAKQDRRGELLLYMHSQLLARYNVERLANHMQRTKRLNLREPIKEGYYPKLDNLLATRVWPGRPPDTRLQDLNRDGFKMDVEDLERWTARIYEGIAVGAFVESSTGRVLNLTEEAGMDLLGNTLESSSLTPNRQLYGELLNQGHILISLAHDPEGRFLESFGVMGDAAVALRDPAFYRWHTYILDIAREHKRTLPAYAARQLDFAEVQVRGLDVQSAEGAAGAGRANVLLTHWQQRDLKLSRGLDFSPRPPVFARVTHLQHTPFTYNIQIENRGAPKEGHVRIFLLPKFDERGKAMPFNDQRHLAVILDKFPTKLATGMNVVRRASSRSSLTIPFERTFRDLDANRPAAGRALQEFMFCGCGLPQHLLLPRGTAEGMPFYLVVVVTDYAQEKVDQVPQGSCNDAHILCGTLGGRYPDRRPMGFPFDRTARRGAESLRTFITPNMFVQSVVVRHRDTIEAVARNETLFGAKDTVHKLPTPQSTVKVKDRVQQQDRLPVIVHA